MFDARVAFGRLDGRTLNPHELRRELEQIRMDNVGELPPEFGIRELLRVAERRNWLRAEQGQLRVVVR